MVAVRRWLIAVGVAAMLVPGLAWAQDTDVGGPMSQGEIEALRESAFVPAERVKAFQRILEDRERAVEALMSHPRHADYGAAMHDLMEQFGAIADELNDNLDEYAKQHRDVRKALPKLMQATERWSTTLRAPGDEAAFKVVRRIALDTVKDTHELAASLLTDEDAYFKEHPDAARAEKLRAENPRAPQ